MASFGSSNMIKCRVRNLKEQRLFNKRLDGLKLSEKSALGELHKEKITLLEQLKISRCKVINSGIRKDMEFHDRFLLDKRTLRRPDRKQLSFFDRSKGFSRVEVHEINEDNLDVYLTLRRNKTLPVVHDQEEISQKQTHFDLTERDIYVHYPTPENKRKGKSIITLAELNACPGRPIDLDLNKSSPIIQQRPKTVSEIQRSRYPLPTYVPKLKLLARQEFDQYTDGTMHLEERKFHQRLLEFMPPTLGHLPVRKRCSSGTLQHSQKDAAKITSVDVVQSLPAKNIKVYIPKSVQLERKQEDKEEIRRLLRVKQEHQAAQYAQVLALTTNFLGKESSSKQLIKFPNLNKKEKVMFEHIKKKLPTFKVAVLVVKWLTKSLRKASAKRREAQIINKEK